MKIILCPTDFSSNATHAIAYASEMALKTNASLILLHTFETPILYSDVAFVTVQYDYKVLHDAAAKKTKKVQREIFCK